MKKCYSLREIRESLPPEKSRADSCWTRWVLRPLSVPAAWLLLRLGFSANAVSYTSGLIAVIGGGFLVSDSVPRLIVGASLFHLFAVLDCADGNIARVTKTTGPWGAWADALGGYAAYASVLLCAGIAAEHLSPGTLPGLEGVKIYLPDGGWAAVGGLTAAANLLMRIAYQGYKNVSGSKAAEKITKMKRISEELGVTGLLIPAVFAGILTGWLPWVVVFYALLYDTGCVLSIVKLIRTVERLVKEGSMKNPAL